jgi:hypothetical protein
VAKILTSSEKITSRGRKIENLDLESPPQEKAPIIANGNGAGRLAG